MLKLWSPSKPRVASAMFARAVFAHKWQRRYINLGAELRDTSVALLNAAKMSTQLRMRTPALGEWPFPSSRAGRLRSCAQQGCDKCKRRGAMIVRGVRRLPVVCWI